MAAARGSVRTSSSGVKERDGDLVRVRVDGHVRPRRVGREDDEPARPAERVRTAAARREADEVSGAQRALAAGVAQDRRAGDDVRPLLDGVVIVIRPDRVAGLRLVHGRADAARAEPLPQGGRRVPEPPPVERLVEVAAEHVHRPHVDEPSSAACTSAAGTCHVGFA